MSNEVCLIGWQYGAEVSKLMEFAKVLKRLLDTTIDCQRERRVIAKQAEKNQFPLVDERFDLVASQQDGVLRIAAHQALFAPHRHEPAVGTQDRLRQPIRVFTELAAPVDECPCEYVVVLHCAQGTCT
jgi:hypothetical protein